MTLDLILPLII